LANKSNNEAGDSIMANLAELFQATKSESNLLVLYVPSGDRDEKPIDQAAWVDKALAMLGTHFGGGTAFRQGKGVWRDDARGGLLIYDAPVIIQCYTNEGALEKNAAGFHAYLMALGVETNQRAIGFVVDNDYIEIQFP
jgi:hypothetical protein